MYRDRYVSFDDLERVRREFDYEPLSKWEYQKHILRLFLKFDFGRIRRFRDMEGRLRKYLMERERLNREFIKREQRKQYKIEGNALDPQQIAAVVACEDAALFLAPAGSGKSASLLAKVEYLMGDLGIPPKQVLVIAFTNKVVAELKERVKGSGVEIRTFHSLGNKIIKQHSEGRKLISEAQMVKFFKKTTRELVACDSKYRRNFQTYVKMKRNGIDVLGEKEYSGIEDLEMLLVSVLGLQKGERASLSEFKKRIEKIEDMAEREKTLKFFELYKPVVEKYREYLRQNKMYDFADMLNEAAEIVEAMPEGSLDYQYILVDEAQDMSTSKYLFLKAILAKCKKVKLFAVGDDWQSIYRFAGSNLMVLDDFEKIFERVTYRGMIELTYRFGQPTARISNKFVQKNPHQSKKKVVPHVKRRTPIEVRLNFSNHYDAPRDYEVVNAEIQKLYRRYGEKLFEKRVQIVARYNRDIYRVVDVGVKKYGNARLVNESEAQMELEWKIERTERALTISFCSMHKAKGITRDIVFVINMNAGSVGMPATRKSEPVMEVLLAKLDDYPFAEERRLFYVAITRAKERTIIVAEAENVSPFVFEINPRLTGTGAKVCPRCKKGVLIEKHRKRDGQIYYICSNKAGGCKYTK